MKYSKEITALQKILAKKEAKIDEIEADRSNLEKILSSTEERNKELESEKTALSKNLQEVQYRLRKLESFTVKPLEVGEDSM